MFISPSISIADWELIETFKKASGPGGQNVNKVETAVELRFDVTNSPSLLPVVKARLLNLAGTRATKDGVIVIEAKRHRRQEQNRADAKDRLAALVRKALANPKKRISTRPSRAAKRRCLDQKNQRSNIKKLRGQPGLDN